MGNKNQFKKWGKITLSYKVIYKKERQVKMNSIKKEYIKNIVDEWDPIDLLPFAPADEYDSETEKIYNTIKNNANVEHQHLSEIIYNVFNEAFGKDVFLKTIEECKIVANKILQIK